MKIHMNHPNPEAVLSEARALAGVYHERCERSGSRTHSVKYDVILSGESGRKTNQRWPGGSAGTEAATWDQWGIYLGYIFEQAPDTKTDDYDDAEDFHRKTGERFDRELHGHVDPESLVVSQSSPDYKITAHRWTRDFSRGGWGAGRGLVCKGHGAEKNKRAECSAVMN